MRLHELSKSYRNANVWVPTWAKQEAEKLLKLFPQEPPIDVHKLVEQLRIELLEKPLEEQVSGMLVLEGDRSVIGVNSSHHKNRQRFTIAHELGHYFLHGSSAKIFIDATPVFLRDESSSTGTQIQEIEANNFAAELLMPEAFLTKLFEREPIDVFDDDAIAALATKFEVSGQAMAIRLSRLNLIPT